MNGKPGRFLSPEQSARLAILDSVDRDKLIEAIVAEMRARADKQRKRVLRSRR